MLGLSIKLHIKCPSRVHRRGPCASTYITLAVLIVTLNKSETYKETIKENWKNPPPWQPWPGNPGSTRTSRGYPWYSYSYEGIIRHGTRTYIRRRKYTEPGAAGGE